jgi:hypothetical protein
MIKNSDPSFIVNMEHFEKCEKATKKGVILKKVVAISSPFTMTELFAFMEDRLVKTIHHRNMLQNYRSCKNVVLDSLGNFAHLIVDFSENLTVPIKTMPQMLYWRKEQKSIHNAVSKFNGQKSYHIHFSNDLTHDQPFVLLSLKDVLDKLDKLDKLLTKSGILALYLSLCKTASMGNYSPF